MYVVECQDLCRSFTLRSKDKKSIKVLDCIDLKIEEGEIYGLVGENGSGKTTLIKILTTLLIPDSGRVFVNGFAVVKEAKEVRKTIGVVLSNNRALYLKLTAWENLKFFAGLYMLPRKMHNEKIEVALKSVDLWDRKDEYVENFSHGMMQRLNIARALLPDPKLLILDEPTNGLDIESTNGLRKLILNLNHKGKTILLTTHALEEIEILSSRMGFLKNGKILKEGVPHILKSQFANKIFEISVEKSIAQECLISLERVFSKNITIKSDVKAESITLHFVGDSCWDIEYVAQKLKMINIEPSQIACKNSSLEDVFWDEMRS